MRITLPPIADGRRQGDTVTVPLDFRPLTGRFLTFTFTGARTETTVNYYSQAPLAMPMGIAELGIPGVDEPAPPASIPAVCTDTLLTVDSKPVWVRVSGSSAAALDGDELPLALCGPDAGGLKLGSGSPYGRRDIWPRKRGPLDGVGPRPAHLRLGGRWERRARRVRASRRRTSGRGRDPDGEGHLL